MSTDRIEAVLAAWTCAGPVPRWHYQMQATLRRTWPTLAGALDRLAARPDIPATGLRVTREEWGWTTPGYGPSAIERQCQNEEMARYEVGRRPGGRLLVRREVTDWTVVDEVTHVGDNQSTCPCESCLDYEAVNDHLEVVREVEREATEQTVVDGEAT